MHVEEKVRHLKNQASILTTVASRGSNNNEEDGGRGENGNKGKCGAMIQQPPQYALGELFPIGRFVVLHHTNFYR